MTHNSRFAVSLHILAYLAHRKGVATPSAELGASVSTNPVVIRRLVGDLQKAGLVSAQKGASGGFILARPAAQITLLDVYRVVEPVPNLGMAHFAPNRDCPVGARIQELLGAVFNRAQASMEGELGRVTLEQLDRELKPVCPGKRRAKAGSP